MSTKWTDREFVVVDVETTSFEMERACICEIAAVIIRNGEVTQHTFETLVNPRVPIEIEAFECHGLSDADVAHAPEFCQVKKGLEEYLFQRTVIAHNADYDIGRLRKVMPFYDFGVVLDTTVLPRFCRINQTYRKLGKFVEKLGLEPQIRSTYRSPETARPHRAGYDAHAAAHLFVRLVRDNFGATTELEEIEWMCGQKYH